ncbi:ferric reductase [Roseobacter denitrificans]|nr:ferric reductase [Roseobacter denitrificans]
MRAVAIWVALALAVIVPVAASAASPLLAWRDPIYIIAGLSGVIALTLLLVQPLLAGGVLPGVSMMRGRRVHRWIGVSLLAAVLVHVAALWITSPPDVVDALLFVSPTPFSLWGVIAMWVIFATALLAALRHRMRLRPRYWRIIHTVFALIIVAGSVVHALLIEGTMEIVSKVALCALVIIATGYVVLRLRAWQGLRRR